MVNLLTPEFRVRSQKAFWSRVGILWALFVIILTLIGLLTLLPAYEATRTTASQQSDDTSRRALGRAESIEVELGNAKRLVDVLNEHIKGSMLIPQAVLVKNIVHAFSGAITVTELSIVRLPDGYHSVKMTGQAKHREMLVALTKKLEEENAIDDVHLPLADLAGRQGVYPFSLDFKMHP